MILLEFATVVLVAVAGFFAGRNYERHNPTSVDEAKSNAAVSEWWNNLFKRK